MRSLLPQLGETTVEAVYGDIPARAAAAAGPVYLLLNMVMSADGAIAVDGVSGGLSGAADKQAFFYLRSLADVILVGAGTARTENYGRPRIPDERRAERQARGQQDVPRIAAVTRSLRMDWSARLFSESRPYLVSCASAPEELQAAGSNAADLILAGDDEVDLAAALGRLAGEGARVVLCEGGPTLNAHLLDAGLVSELCLTISPGLVGGSGAGLTGWTQAHDRQPLELLALAEDSGFLLLRYAVNSARHDSASTGPG